MKLIKADLKMSLDYGIIPPHFVGFENLAGDETAQKFCDAFRSLQFESFLCVVVLPLFIERMELLASRMQKTARIADRYDPLFNLLNA